MLWEVRQLFPDSNKDFRLPLQMTRTRMEPATNGVLRNAIGVCHETLQQGEVVMHTYTRRNNYFDSSVSKMAVAHGKAVTRRDFPLVGASWQSKWAASRRHVFFLQLVRAVLNATRSHVEWSDSNDIYF